MNVELRDEARDDLVEGAVFYGEQSDGLDGYFLKCLREDIEKLESTPGFMNNTTVSIAPCQNAFLTRSTIWFLESL